MTAPLEQAQYDTRIEVTTPENISFQYRLAGPFRRAPAYLIDVIIRAIILGGVAWWMRLLMPLAGGTAIGFLLIIHFLLEWFYGGICEAWFNGQTPGKRMLRLRVMGVDGQPIAAWQAILRNFLRFVDAQPFYTFAVGLFACGSNVRYQRLGDLAAGTMVVVEEWQRAAGVVRIDEPEALQLAKLLPANLVIPPSLARALSDYVVRRKRFDRARRADIARHVAVVMIERLGLPPTTNYDHLLCAMYQRAFFSETTESETDSYERFVSSLK